MRVAIHTLGCKVNQYESQAMEELLRARGHTLVPFEDQADAYLINSCTVTAVSDKKSRQAVRQVRRRAPEALIALCGCYPQVSPDQAAALGADLIGGTGDRVAFLDKLEALAQDKVAPAEVLLDDPFRRMDFEVLPAGGLAGRTRAMLKVEDGCTNFCTYCIIPYARGRVRSLPLDQAAAEAARLAQEGYRELVVTGIELSGYGRDLPGRPSLAQLIEAVCRAAPGLRVRLGSLEPRTVTEDFCRALADLPNLCPHFHLSLQSGCDATLARMGRKYTGADYEETVARLNQWFDRPAVTTDLIVGFPGETEEEFAQSLALVQRCRLARVHVFPYSRRQGTPAAAMPGQVPNAVKADRAHRAGEVLGQVHTAWLAGWVGQTIPVLFEEEKGGWWRGYGPQYMEVRVQGEDLHNQLLPVTITDFDREVLYGQCRKEEP